MEFAISAIAIGCFAAIILIWISGP